MDCRNLADLSGRVERVMGRIDSRVARLAAGLEVDPQALAQDLDSDTEELHQLLDSLVRAATETVRSTPADLEQIAAAAVRATLQELRQPVVFRQRFAGGLPPVAWSQGDLASAVRRAIDLAAHHAGHGGEVLLSTGRAGEKVVLEVEATGSGDAHAADRTVTLRDYVAGLGGRCEAGVAADGALRLRLQLPAGAAVDER